MKKVCEVLPLLELIRTRQWLKNFFVLAPLFFSHSLITHDQLIKSFAAFFSFCFISSAVYIFNDLQDIQADLHHKKKKLRPLPSGRVGIFSAILVMIFLMFFSFATIVYFLLPNSFMLIILLYGIINLMYSLGLKHVSVVELFMVSSGFLLRLIGGGCVINAELSPWILSATGSIALLLVVGKRRGDLIQSNDSKSMRRSINGYNLLYLDAMISVLSSATLIVYLLFTVSSYAEEIYGKMVILTTIPVVMGLFRYLQLLYVFKDGDAPTDMLIKDKMLIYIVLTFCLFFIFIKYQITGI